MNIIGQWIAQMDAHYRGQSELAITRAIAVQRFEIQAQLALLQGGAASKDRSARIAHNDEVGGSNPSPATTITANESGREAVPAENGTNFSADKNTPGSIELGQAVIKAGAGDDGWYELCERDTFARCEDNTVGPSQAPHRLVTSRRGFFSFITTWLNRWRRA